METNEILNYLSQNWLWMVVYMFISYILAFLLWLSFGITVTVGQTAQSGLAIFSSLILGLLLAISAVICGILGVVFKFAFIIGLVLAVINFIKQ